MKVQSRFNYLILIAAFIVAIGGFTVAKTSGCSVAPILLNTPRAKVELIKHIKASKMIVFDYSASFDASNILYDVQMETKADPIVDVGFTVKTTPKDTTKKSGGALFWVMCSNGKNGYIDNTGKIVIQPRFDWTLPFSEGLAHVSINRKWGYIDSTGKFVIEPKFDHHVEPFSEGLAVVWVNNYYTSGYINKKGEMVIDARFFDAKSFSEGLGCVGIGKTFSTKKWGYIDGKGNIVIEPKFEGAGLFSEGLARVKIDDDKKWGFINQAGNLVIEARFDEAKDFSQGLAAVMLGDKIGYIDKGGKMVIQPKFDFGGQFSEGLAQVILNRKAGYIDKEGKLMIPFKFKGIIGLDGVLSEGLAYVIIDGKTGFIDRSGKVIIEPKFSRAEPFSNGLARVEVRSGYWGYIDKTGKYIYVPTNGAGNSEGDLPTLGYFQSDTTNPVRNAEQIIKIKEAIEAGEEFEIIPGQVDLQQAIIKLDVYLQANPEDVHALILFARLGGFVNLSELTVFTRGKDTPPPEDKYEPLQAALDKALKLEPNNAEAHYWKARLYGIRVPDVSTGVMNYRYLDIDRAISFARRSVELDPENVAYKEALALYLVAKQKPEEAIEVLQDVEDGNHPIYLLLKDMQVFPIPDDVVYLPEESEGMGQMMLMSFSADELTRDYADLRIHVYMLPMSAIEVETFYRSFWPKFQLFEMQEKKYESVDSFSMSIFIQFLNYEEGVLQPVSKIEIEKIDKMTDFTYEGIILGIYEMKNIPPEGRARLPAFDGDVMCYLIIINLRKF